MAAQFYKINYKSDFVLTINSDAGWAVPFCIKFWTGMPSHGYFAGFDGENYVNCRVGDTPTQLLVMFDDHHMPIGPLRMQIAYHTTIEEFPDRKFDEVTNPTNVTVDIDGTEYQVMLDFTGETGAEIDFSMPSSGVMSVNGKIGYVTLNAEDVGAQPTIEDLATIRSGAAAGATAVQTAEMTAALATKQDTINDLATIRSGAAAGATAVQPATLQEGLATKQDTISDLATIRSGAAAGATAVQPAALQEGLATKQDVISDLSTIRSGAAAGATAVQPAALTPIESDIDAIEGKIPSAASTSNQLADKAFVNSALADKADTSDIPTALSQLSQDSTHRVVTDAEKSTWNGKQNAISDLATIRSGAAAGATAVQPAAMNTALAAKQDTLTFDNTPTANSNNPVKSSGIKTALDAKQSTISTVNVTVDNNTGTPSGSASVSGSTLSLSFQNLKGATGATGATGPQGPQGERGLPGESGVTGDVSGFTVIQTIDPSATYGATDIAGAATVQATNQELTELAVNITGIIGENTSYDGNSDIWLNNGKYIKTDGTLANGSDWSVSKPILIGEGSLITINTQGSGLCVIAQTDVQGSSYTPLVNAPSSSTVSNRAYAYKAISDIYVALSGKIGLGDVSVVLSVPSKTEKVINDALDEFSTKKSLLVSGGYIDTNGNIQSNNSWIYTDYIEVDIKSGDSFVWGGIINYSSACLVFYNENKTKKGAYSANGESRSFTVASSVVGAKYIRASFYANATPFLSINGTEIVFEEKRTINTDSTMTLDLPANAKGVGEYISNILGISVFKDGYFINLDGNEEASDLWCYAEISLSEPVKAGDVYVWTGIMNNTDAAIYFYGADGSHKGAYSATGTSRTFTIGNSSSVIGATKIKASFLISSKDSASVSINGVVQEFSVIKEDKSVAEYNADKQPMVTSLSRRKVNFGTTQKYLCFAQISDTHGENILVQRAVDFINSEEFESIDCIVHTGDIQFYSFNNGDMPAFHNAMDNSLKPAFTVLGNHDVYESTTLSGLYERFMKPMVDKGLLVAGTNIDAANYSTWYYYDWTDYGVRMIMLNDFDPLYDGYTKPLNTTAYSPSQINFLISTLQSVPSGYTVIILDHFPSNNAENYIGHLVTGGWTCGNQMGDFSHASLFTGNASPVMDILGAYKSKTTLTQSYTYTNSNVASQYGSIDINVDFTSANGTFGFMACGHNHNDLIYTFPHQSDILAIGMLGGVNPTYIDSITNIFRTYSGKAHDAINVYCVRTDERKVYVIRIGADFRADGKEQVITSFEY